MRADARRSNSLKAALLLGAVSVLGSYATLVAAAQSGPDAAATETLQLRSEVFGNTRTIRVLLPPGYRQASNAKIRYPVLYLNDGNTVFRRYDLEKTVHGLIRSGAVVPLIVVGIDNGGATDTSTNTGRDRMNEYLPYADAGFGPERLYVADPAAPVGKLYPRFLKEVMSLIDRHYRTKTGPEHTGIGGSSFGGVAALFAVTAMPQTFGKVLLESTPLWIGPKGELMRDVRLLKRWPVLFYIGISKVETPDEVVSSHGMKLRDVLLNHIREVSPRTQLMAVVDEAGKHDSATWARRFPDALRFLFGGNQR